MRITKRESLFSAERLESFKSHVAEKLITNPDFHPRKSLTGWSLPAYEQLTMTAPNFVSKHVSAIMRSIAQDCQNAQDDISSALSFRAKNEENDHVAQLVKIEMGRLKGYPLSCIPKIIRKYARSDHTSIGSIIHGDLRVQAMNYIQQIEASKTYISGLIEDPYFYHESIQGKRRDIASALLADHIGRRSHSYMSDWREDGDILTRGLFVEASDGAMTPLLFSATFYPNRSELLQARFSKDDVKQDFDMEI